MKKIEYKNIDFNKLSISFSWDDNFLSHYYVISEIFSEFNKKCTFYINIGEDDFESCYLKKYKDLFLNGFELGNHLYKHKYSTKLSTKEFENLISMSLKSYTKFFNTLPTTFAFPYHNCNEDLENKVLTKHIAIRNKLYNTKRISLNTTSNLENIEADIKKYSELNYNIVFSGHSIIPNKDYKPYSEQQGYEPINVELLKNVLKLCTSYEKYQILTVEQAALKHYIKTMCQFDNRHVRFNYENIEYLSNVGFDFEKISTFLNGGLYE